MRKGRTFLSTADTFLDGVGEIWLASANIGAEYVRPVACE